MRKVSRKRFPEFLKKLVVVLVAASLAVLLLEGLVKVFIPQRIGYLEADEYLYYKPIPNKEFEHFSANEYSNSIKINSKGLRDYEYGYEKEPGTFRLLVLGDSIVEALQVPLEDTFSKRLEKTLNERYPDGKFEIISAGVSSYSSENEIMWLEREGAKYSPDAVLMVFFANDIWENRFKEIFVVENGSLIENVPLKIKLSDRLSRQCISISHLCRLTYFQIVGNDFLRDIFSDFRSVSGNDEVKHTYFNMPKALFLNVADTKVEEAWAETELQIRLFKEISQEMGFVPIVSYMPLKEQIDDSLMKDFVDRYFEEGESPDLSKPSERIFEMSKRANITFVQPLEIFEKFRGGEKLYYTYDGHLNKRGHEVFAQFLLEILESEDLLRLK